MKTTHLLILSLAMSFTARADFSYTQTVKSPGGVSQVTRMFFKGSRMVSDAFTTTNIIDFQTQTITVINKTAKSYTVQKFAGLMQASKGRVPPKIDMRETGQRKTINGFNCSQILMTMSVDAPASATPGKNMRVEMEMWISPDVPGWQNLRAFHQDNALSFAAVAARNSGVARALAEMEDRLATANGLPVLEVLRMKSSGGDPKAAQARSALEQLAMQPGPEGEMAKQALSRLAAAGPATSVFETTLESSNFSTAGIPDSVFVIPAGFTRK
ncbi:MAG: DUF4412 domain-containing protein [Candidatus Sulfopaludibacter sp.]|nr:DUF4412 domain-containing protein [Candidatus Sulfopaludibacter sp.]